MLKDKRIVRRLAFILCLSLLVGLVPASILGVPFGVNAADASVNLLANGSFENEKEGWGGSADVTVEDGAAIVPAVAGARWCKSDRIAATGGETYRVSAMTKRLSGEKTGYIGIWYVDANGAYVGDGAKAVSFNSDEWTEASMELTLPAGVAFIWVEFGVNSGMNSSFAVDNVVLNKISGAPEASEPEESKPDVEEPVVIIDDGFENGTDGWKNTIVAEGAGKAGNAMQICIDNSGKDIETANASRIPVAAGQKYKLTFFAKRDASDESDKSATAYLIWYDAAGQLNNPAGTDLNDNATQKWHSKVNVNPGSEWTEYELEAVVPEGAATMAIRFYVGRNTSLNLYVDDILLVQLPTGTSDATEPEAPVGDVIFTEKFENIEIYGKNRLPVGWTSYSPENIRVACNKSYFDVYEGYNLFFQEAKGDKWAKSPLFDVTPGNTYTAKFMELKMPGTVGNGGYIAIAFVDANGAVLKSATTSIGQSAAWTANTFSAIAPAGAVKGYVEFGLKSATGNPEYAVDNLEVYEAEGADIPEDTTPTAPAESGSVVNGGFENGLDAWANSSALSIVEDDKHSGEAALKFVDDTTAGATFFKQKVSVIPGMTYTLSAWVKVLEGKGGYIGLYGIGGNNDATGFSGLEVGKWEKVSVTVVIPYGYDLVEVEFGTNSNQVVTYLLDDIELTLNEDVGPAETEPEPTETIVPEGEKVYEEQFEEQFTPEGAPGTCHMPVGWTASQHSAAIGTATYDTAYNGSQNLCIQDAKDKWIKSHLVAVTPGYEYTVSFMEHKFYLNERGAGGYAAIVFVDAEGNVLKQYTIEAGQSKYWTQMLLYGKAPANATHFYVEFGLAASSGQPTFSVDELTVYAVEASLDDPDVTQPTEATKPLDPMKPFEENFETPADDDDLNAGPKDWECNDDSAEAYGTMISLANNSLSLDGNYLRLSKINTWTATSPEFPVQIGYAYTVKFMARKLVDNENFNGSVDIVFVNTRGKTVEVHSAVAGKTFGEWAEESLTAVAPIGAYKAYVVLRVTNNGRNVNADFAVDNLAVVRDEEPSFEYEQEATEPIVYIPILRNEFKDSYNPEGAASTVRFPVDWTGSHMSAALGIGNYDKYEGTSTLFIQNKGDKWMRSPSYDAKAGYNYLVSYVEKKYYPADATGGYMRLVFVNEAGVPIAEFTEDAGYSKKWTEMEYEFTAPAGTVKYYIEFGILGGTGGDPTYGIDNLVIYESEKQVATPSNPSNPGNPGGNGGNGGSTNPDDNAPTGDTTVLTTVSTVLVAAVALAVLVLKKRRFF